jgi:hypothetical protein
MTLPTDAQLNNLPHVFITSDSPWDPSVIDNEFHDTEHADFVLEHLPEALETPIDPELEQTH